MVKDVHRMVRKARRRMRKASWFGTMIDEMVLILGIYRKRSATKAERALRRLLSSWFHLVTSSSQLDRLHSCLWISSNGSFKRVYGYFFGFLGRKRDGKRTTKAQAFEHVHRPLHFGKLVAQLFLTNLLVPSCSSMIQNVPHMICVTYVYTYIQIYIIYLYKVHVAIY